MCITDSPGFESKASSDMDFFLMRLGLLPEKRFFILRANSLGLLIPPLPDVLESLCYCVVCESIHKM